MKTTKREEDKEGKKKYANYWLWGILWGGGAGVFCLVLFLFTIETKTALIIACTATVLGFIAGVLAGSVDRWPARRPFEKAFGRAGRYYSRQERRSGRINSFRGGGETEDNEREKQASCHPTPR